MPATAHIQAISLPAILAILITTVPAQNPADPQSIRFKEEKVGFVSIASPVGGFQIQGVDTGISLNVDEAFTTKNEGRPPTASFRIVVPKEEDIRMLAGGKKTGAPELIKLTLVDPTGSKAAEILRFGHLEINQGPAEKRLQVIMQVLRTDAFKLFTSGYENARELEVYYTKVGQYDAAVMHLEMTSPKSGEHYLVKGIAILHPTRDHGVLGFLMANTALSEIKTLEDLSSKGVSMRIIHSLKFLEH